MSISIKLASIFVDDQEKALQFYTKILGFQTKTDIPAGDYRWLTVVGANAPEGTELLLEPNVHKAARQYQQSIFADQIPCTTFFVDDLQAEFERLSQAGVKFTTPPKEVGPVSIAVLDDTCGNLVQLVQQ